MVRNSMRVVLASDQPEIRRYLGKVVEEKLGGVVVGEGENAISALRLARRLRPDVAIIDSYLPHSRALNEVPLSRGAGLDIAQVISAEIPDVRVVLVDSGEAASVFPDDLEGILMRPSLSATEDMALSRPQASLTFASLLTESVRPRTRGFSDTCITVGMCGLLFGLVLIATMFLAYAGFPFLLLGIVSLSVGCIVKLISSLRSGGTGVVEGFAADDRPGRTGSNGEV